MCLKYLIFWSKFRVLDRNTRFFVWMTRFLIWNMYCQNTKRESASTYMHMSCDSLPPFTELYSFWMTPHSLFACILPGCPLTMRNNEDKKREICILLRQIKKTSEKESDLTISSMEPTSFMPKVLTEEWKIFFFVVLFSVGNLACFQDY